MADILIRMEMPKHCFDCSTKIDPDNRRCNIDGHVFVETLSKLTCRRDENCPLRELPPHGDLIDRDIFIDSLPYGDIEHDEKIWRTAAIGDAILLAHGTPVVIPSNKERSDDA